MKKATVKYLSISEFCKLHKLTRPTLRRWLNLGRVPGAMIEENIYGNVWVIPEDLDVESLRMQRGRPKKIKESK